MKIALTNVPPDHSKFIAHTLVEEGTVACINLYPVRSVYIWKNELQIDEEVTLMMKVSKEGVEALKNRLCEIHPYELPEFVILDVDTEASLQEYVEFVREGTLLK